MIFSVAQGSSYLSYVFDGLIDKIEMPDIQYFVMHHKVYS